MRHREHTALRVLSLMPHRIKGNLKVGFRIDGEKTLFDIQYKLLHIRRYRNRIAIVIMPSVAFILRVDNDERRSPVRTALIMLVKVRD